MAPEYIESDIDGLYILASLWDEFWRTGGTDGKLAGEIRLQGARFGLSSLDRRRLEWELEKPEEPEELTSVPAVAMVDPRLVENPKGLAN
jgi:hypothetical protein